MSSGVYPNRAVILAWPRDGPRDTPRAPGASVPTSELREQSRVRHDDGGCAVCAGRDEVTAQMKEIELLAAAAEQHSGHLLSGSGLQDPFVAMVRRAKEEGVTYGTDSYVRIGDEWCALKTA